MFFSFRHLVSAQEKRSSRSAHAEHPEYQKLPEVVKHTLSEKQYSWMDDTRRENLIDSYCLPDYEEDD